MGIYVWGTGCGASELIDKGLEWNRITAFVDSSPGDTLFFGKPVLLPEQLDAQDCQLMIVTVRQANAVVEQCQALGIEPERLLLLKNSHLLTDRNGGSVAADVLGTDLLARLLPRQRVITEPQQLAASRLPETDLENDYVRMATLELLCRRLQNVPGAVAELGVYRGFFAACIQRLLPERTLYLFDSFVGFSQESGASASFQAAHANTSIRRVLQNLPYPQQAVVKPGFFPDSLQGLEAQFCLVSLDVDFYQTTLEGLRYFWPRLTPGGYLLLHDWDNPKLPQVAQALEDYQRQLGQVLPAVPLCDIGGTLVLCKVFG